MYSFVRIATNQLPLSPVQIQPSPPYYRQPSQDDGRKVNSFVLQVSNARLIWICKTFRASHRRENVDEYHGTVPCLGSKYERRHHSHPRHRYTPLHRHGNFLQHPKDDHLAIICPHAVVQQFEIVTNDTPTRSDYPIPSFPVTILIRLFTTLTMVSMALITVSTTRTIICTVPIIICITRIRRIPIIHRVQDTILRRERTVLWSLTLDKSAFPV